MVRPSSARVFAAYGGHNVRRMVWRHRGFAYRHGRDIVTMSAGSIMNDP